ncbi:MAG: hypothetical protein JWQ60_84 [Pseudonocardia sp.]|nr:hypothetical protein [Pseudonocardia sp.]
MCPQQPPRGSEIDTAGEDVYVLSYAGLRKAVGYFGLLLPIVVFVVGIALPPHEFLGSISAYYYVPFAGNIFVGALWTIGVFLWFYNYRQPDNILTSAAGTFAIGVATFPTAKQGMPRSLFSTATIHLVCAALFFSILAILSLFYFTRGTTAGRPRKKSRNRVYVACGLVIVVALIVAGLGPLVLGSDLYNQRHVLFYCETAASWAFGISWLVKGQALFPDVPSS